MNDPRIKNQVHCCMFTLDLSIFAKTVLTKLTGYNQSVTGCGSQRRHVVVTQRKLI